MIRPLIPPALIALALWAMVPGAASTAHAATAVDSAQLLRQRIVAAYGVDRFDEIRAMRYTFNIKMGDREVSRDWTWEPHTGCVTYHGKSPQGAMIDFAYTHTVADTADTSLTTFVDQRFVNDNYWLLFPFHLAWDSNMVLSTSGPTEAPEAARGRRLTVRYTAGGYSPGDMYELFSDPEGLLTWWVFHRGGDPTHGATMSWQQNVRAGPITLTIDHRTPEGAVRLWFSNIAVKLKGSDAWIEAK